MYFFATISLHYYACAFSSSPFTLIPLLAQQPADSKSSPLTVTHYHFYGWPDHGVPLFATAFIGFTRRVRSNYNKAGPPMLVHCSAGVGRTGVFIALDSMLERVQKEKTVNVYEFLTNMRRKRIQMVQAQVCGVGVWVCGCMCLCMCRCMYSSLIPTGQGPRSFQYIHE